MTLLCFQVIVVDHDSDEELVKVDAKAAEAIDLHCDQGPVACIQVSSLSGCLLLGRSDVHAWPSWFTAQQLTPVPPHTQAPALQAPHRVFSYTVVGVTRAGSGQSGLKSVCV